MRFVADRIEVNLQALAAGRIRAIPLIKILSLGRVGHRRAVGKQAFGSSGWVYDGHAPGAGVAVTAGFDFDTPVRFDTDRIEVNLQAFAAGRIPAIPLIEILP